MAYTTEDFVTAVRRQARLPTTGAFTDAQIRAFGDDAISMYIVPLIRAVRAEYWVRYEDVTMVIGTSEYRIPTRTIAGTLRDVRIVETDGTERTITEITVDDAFTQATTSNGTVVQYTVIGDKLRLYKAPATALTLRMYYERRPSKMVPTANCALITTSGDADPEYIVTTEAHPASFPVDTYGFWDIVQEFPNFDVPLLDAYGLAASGGPTVTFTVALGSYAAALAMGTEMEADNNLYGSAVVGRRYYMCVADQTPFVPVPTSAYDVTVRFSVALALETLGDRQGAALAMDGAEKAMANLLRLLAPRTSGNDQRIVNRSSPLRSRRL